jgi:signal transduction histidine kinase
MENPEDISLLLPALIAILFFFFLALFVVLLYLRYQQNMYRKEKRLQAIRNSYQEDLIHSSIQVQESERKRFSKDLHDEVSAMLSAIKLQMAQIEKHIQVPEAQQAIARAQSMLESTSQSVRGISHALMPPVLESYGLFYALEQHFQKLCTDSMQAEFSFDSDQARLNFEQELALYRIALELSNNTLKYAEATEISLDICVENGQLEFRYRDNGKGFDLEAPKSKGLGLKSIESRASFLKATLSWHSAPQQGLQVLLQMPCVANTIDEHQP